MDPAASAIWFENCTLHNYAVVPSKKRDILVHGSYQSGIGVLDFTDLEDIREIGFADPKPLNPDAVDGRRRLVVALLQRPDLRVRHHPRPAHVAVPGRRAGRQPALDRLTRRRRSSPPASRSRLRPGRLAWAAPAPMGP